MESRGPRNDNRIMKGTESELSNVDAVCPSYRGCVVELREGARWTLGVRESEA